MGKYVMIDDIRWWLRNHWFDTLAAIVLIILVIFVLFGVAILVVSSRAEAICLEHGYNEAIVGINFKPYCNKLVDATNIVIPLQEVVSGG